MKTIPSQEWSDKIVASVNQSIADARKDERRKVWEEAAALLQSLAEESQDEVLVGREVAEFLDDVANRLRAKAEE